MQFLQAAVCAIAKQQTDFNGYNVFSSINLRNPSKSMRSTVCHFWQIAPFFCDLIFFPDVFQELNFDASLIVRVSE